jgi:hypothetical protein
LATRSGSTAETKAIMENRGSSRKPRVWVWAASIAGLASIQ